MTMLLYIGLTLILIQGPAIGGGISIPESWTGNVARIEARTNVYEAASVNAMIATQRVALVEARTNVYEAASVNAMSATGSVGRIEAASNAWAATVSAFDSIYLNLSGVVNAHAECAGTTVTISLPGGTNYVFGFNQYNWLTNIIQTGP